MKCNAPFSGFANCVLEKGHPGRHAHTTFSPPGAPAPSLPPGNTGPERHPSELSERGDAYSSQAEIAPRTPSPSRSESSEAPYPEAPLASRRAELSGREQAEPRTGLHTEPRPESSLAENQAEALAVERHQERKHGADPKPPPRWIDPEVFGTFHAQNRECIACGYWRASAHHLVKRSQGGDDVMENLIPLCGACHGALHDGNSYHAYGVTHTPEGVRNRIGASLTPENIEYVKAKLGVGAGVFLARYGVEL